MVGDLDCDWKVGEWIVIAPTCRDPKEGERKQITARTVNGAYLTLTLDSNLAYTHSVSESYTTSSGETVTLRGEVGLLTRNVVIRGDPLPSDSDENGAILRMFTDGDDTSFLRIDSVEFHHVG